MLIGMQGDRLGGPSFYLIVLQFRWAFVLFLDYYGDSARMSLLSSGSLQEDRTHGNAV